jgi:hypothetical protein
VQAKLFIKLVTNTTCGLDQRRNIFHFTFNGIRQGVSTIAARGIFQKGEGIGSKIKAIFFMKKKNDLPASFIHNNIFIRKQLR